MGNEMISIIFPLLMFKKKKKKKNSDVSNVTYTKLLFALDYQGVEINEALPSQMEA
jgi:hypothetical protein